MRYRVRHETHYRYSEDVTLCHNEVRMRPLNESPQLCTRSEIRINPEPALMEERIDYFGNRVVYFDVEQPHSELVVTVDSDVETPRERFDLLLPRMDWQEVVERLRLGRESELREQKLYTLATPATQWLTELNDLARDSFPPGRSLMDGATNLMDRIFTEYKYDATATTVATPLSQVVRQKRGVCQDFAHLGIAVLRQIGLAARYVSGYMETLPPPGQKKLRGADASHAWFSVHFPGAGWLDFDPTNNKMPDERYVVVAHGRDYGDVPPLKGIVFGGGNMQLSVAVDVEPCE